MNKKEIMRERNMLCCVLDSLHMLHRKLNGKSEQKKTQKIHRETSSYYLEMEELHQEKIWNFSLCRYALRPYSALELNHSLYHALRHTKSGFIFGEFAKIDCMIWIFFLITIEKKH